MDYRIFNVHKDANACNCKLGGGWVWTPYPEFALKTDSERKIPCLTRESNLCQWRAGQALYQLSYISNPQFSLNKSVLCLKVCIRLLPVLWFVFHPACISEMTNIRKHSSLWHMPKKKTFVKVHNVWSPFLSSENTYLHRSEINECQKTQPVLMHFKIKC